MQRPHGARRRRGHVDCARMVHVPHLRAGLSKIINYQRLRYTYCTRYNVSSDRGINEVPSTLCFCSLIYHLSYDTYRWYTSCGRAVRTMVHSKTYVSTEPTQFNTRFVRQQALFVATGGHVRMPAARGVSWSQYFGF